MLFPCKASEMFCGQFMFHQHETMTEFSILAELFPHELLNVF